MKRLPFWRRPRFARRVLDIGAGHNPFKGVTHVVEIDIHQGRERAGHAIVVPGSANLIVGDGMALPFGSGTFDYVYASHVLEHVGLPELACGEIMRVGSAGYIETPSPFLEQGLALREGRDENSLHRWFVFPLDEDLLVFEPRTSETVSDFCSCPDGQFMKEFYDSVDFRQAQHCFRRKAKTTIFYWRSSFGVDVRKRTADCLRDGGVCRFRGMRGALLANCHDLFCAPRLRRLKESFPECTGVLRKFGHRPVFLR